MYSLLRHDAFEWTLIHQNRVGCPAKKGGCFIPLFTYHRSSKDNRPTFKTRYFSQKKCTRNSGGKMIQQHELYFTEETNGLFAIAYIYLSMSQLVSFVDDRVLFFTPSTIEPGEQAFLLSFVNAYRHHFNKPIKTMVQHGRSHYATAEIVAQLNISEWDLLQKIIQYDMQTIRRDGNLYIAAHDVLRIERMGT
jgi:hypothetical protein